MCLAMYSSPLKTRLYSYSSSSQIHKAQLQKGKEIDSIQCSWQTFGEKRSVGLWPPRKPFAVHVIHDG